MVYHALFVKELREVLFCARISNLNQIQSKE